MCAEIHNRPRVGIPWRTTQEEKDRHLSKLVNYCSAVRQAGGEPVPLSLMHSSAELRGLLPALDAFLLPGSPDDVAPARYGAADQGKCAAADPNREQTDAAILDHAFAGQKPVLAVCYGMQLLNVHLGGTLIQDIWSDIEAPLRHRHKDPPGSKTDPMHGVTLEPGSRLATLAGGLHAEVNSSHHQAVKRPGRGLRVTASAPDGVVEAVERPGGAAWVVGVEWHPERMAGDAFAERLFRDFVTAARGAAVRA